MTKLDDIPDRPGTPVVIRFIGCDAEMAGVNQDFFTIGDARGCDVAFPAALARDGQTTFRVGRAAEGWRINGPSGAIYYLNQELATRSVRLRSGDVIRLVPGGPGIQFNILNQNADSLSKLAARFAPRLVQTASELDSSGKTTIPPATATVASGSNAAVGGDPTPPAQDKKYISPASSFGVRWLGSIRRNKSTAIALVVIAALVAIAALALLWPAGDSIPVEDSPPPTIIPRDTSS